MAETTKERLNKQFAQLESERQSFERAALARVE